MHEYEDIEYLQFQKIISFLLLRYWIKEYLFLPPSLIC